MNSRRRIILLGLCLSFLFSTGSAEESPLASAGLIRALQDEVSGEIAYRYTALVSGYDRIQASEGFRAAADAIKDELERIGYEDVAIEGWPSDGTRRYYTYRSVIGWKAKTAELWMISPSRERMCSYEELPLTLVKHSGSGNVEAELVDVGSGMGDISYEGKDVKGKIVLAYGSTSQVMNEAVLKRGAVGVLTYMAPDNRPGYPDMIRYTALWPTWEEKARLGFAFNVSKNQGASLKRMLEERQKVVLKAVVETEFTETKLEILTAAWPGSREPEKEILIIGHLCHPTPSANDNASGSGGMLEMARALKKMVDSGVIEAPKRTIRFLWVPEFMGTVPYIQAHLERTRNTLAAINCDMIGEDLHKTGGRFGIYRTPDSMPTYLNDVVANFAGLAERLNLTSINGSTHPFAWKSHPYSGGSDHVIFNDGALKVPSVMLNRGDTFHHTSLDTMDKVDATELRRACFIALGSAYYLASAGETEAGRISRLILRNGLGRITAEFYDTLESLHDAPDPETLHSAFHHLQNVIFHLRNREHQAILSTKVFVQDPETVENIRRLGERLKEITEVFPKEADHIYRELAALMKTSPRAYHLTDKEKALSKLIPIRDPDFICPLSRDYVTEKLGRDALSDIALRGNTAYEILNFVDGERSLYEIARAVSAEFGPVDVSAVHSFFMILEEAGLVRMKDSS